MPAFSHVRGDGTDERSRRACRTLRGLVALPVPQALIEDVQPRDARRRAPISQLDAAAPRPSASAEREVTRVFSRSTIVVRCSVAVRLNAHRSNDDFSLAQGAN